MLRRISTKLVLAVLAAVVLPFVAFAFFINAQMEERLTHDVVTGALMGLVQDLAGQIDRFVEERQRDVIQWAGDPQAAWALDDDTARRALLARGEIEAPAWGPDEVLAHARGASFKSNDERIYHLLIETQEFDRYVGSPHSADLVLLVNAQGRLATCSSRTPDGEVLPEAFLRTLFETDFSQHEWFREAAGGRLARVDNHRSPYGAPFSETGSPDDPSSYHIGFASPVFRIATPDDLYGVLYCLINWRYIQGLVENDVVKVYFSGLVEEEQQPSPYAWVWKSDADTIIGHETRALYGRSVSNDPDIRLPQLVEAVRRSQTGWDLYPEYTFRGKRKNAAFKLTAGSGEGGFGWVVGVGIDNDDIYATSTRLRDLLMGGTAVVLLMAVLWTMVIARRATQPIRELQRHTRRVAGGELGLQIEIRSRDELGELARDFNAMTRQLEEHREQLVKAEKDAAWREMARQIAHDIKNPLTPIQLSLDLLERARRERNPGYGEILERTMDLIGRQVTNLREIASDFYEFTGGRRPDPQIVDLGGLMDDVLRLYDAWAVEQGVAIQREGPGGKIHADPGKLRRVFGNLITNSLQAMPAGGSLSVEVAPEEGGGRIRVLVADTGPGIPADVRAHLFEPYFTTRSEGTGLGLAIARRVIEELGGTIELRPRDGGDVRGTVAIVTLPAWDGREASAAP